MGPDAFVECKDGNDAFVKELAPPLPPLFDLSLTNLHVLMNDDVLVFEFGDDGVFWGAIAASADTIPESCPESYSLPEDTSLSCCKPLLVSRGLVVKEYGEGIEVTISHSVPENTFRWFTLVPFVDFFPITKNRL